MTAGMTQQHLRRQASVSTSASSSSNYSDDVKKEGEQGAFANRASQYRGSPLTSTSTTTTATTTTTTETTRSFNKNPLKPGKDGAERLAAIFRITGESDAAAAADVEGSTSTTTDDSGSHYQNPLEDDAIRSSSSYNTETAAGAAALSGVSYFPDQVARVSYVASIVNPDANGDYLKDLLGGMDLLATRLAPSYFPGTIVRDITTQVDGYFPAGESS